MKILLRFVAGIIGGLVGGMGMGGGTLLIPILTIFLAFQQLQAQGINLIAFLPMSAVAIFVHCKNKLVRFKETWLLALVGAGASFLSAFVATNLNNYLLKKLFAVFLIGLSIWQIVEVIKAINKSKKGREKDKLDVKSNDMK